MAKMTEQIKKRGLEVPAVMFLEMHKPLANVFGQASIALTPFLAPMLGMANVHDYGRFFMQRDNFEQLIQSLESKDDDTDGGTATEETTA